MEFIETGAFERAARGLFNDDELLRLQLALMLRPDAGVIIPASGGLRKLRWSLKGRGKRGGARVIYYWMRGQSIIYLVFAYAKNKQEDLTPDQLRLLRQFVED
jgi:hypothetical protein